MAAAAPAHAPPSLSQIFPFPIDIQKEEYVVLRDSSGKRHHVCRRAAIQSPVLKLMEISGDVPVRASPEVVDVLIAYMHYKLRYGPHTANSAAREAPPFFNKVTPALALDVAQAAKELGL